jgi:Large polyvalent protein associated domain 38
VQSYRDRVIALEEQLAKLRGEEITAKKVESKGKLPTFRYPFAVQKYENELKAAQASLKAAKKQQTETREQIKSQTQQMEEFWQNQLGGRGVQRKAGFVEPLLSTEEKRLEQLRREERERMDRAIAAEEKQLAKDKQIESLDQQVAGLIEELGAFEQFPNELAELKSLANNEALPQEERSAALAKAGIIQNITSLEAQRDTLLEGKPAAKRRAATVASSSAMAKQKPLRTGFVKALGEASEALKKERAEPTQIPGVYGSEDLGGLFEFKQDRLFQAANTAATGPALKEPVDVEQNAGAVMGSIAKTSADPITRAIAARLQMLLGQTRVEIVNDLRDDKGNPVFGSATIDGRLISLDRSAGLNEQTVVHEGIHAATERVLRMPEEQLTPDQLAAKRELEELYKAFKADKKAPNANAKSSMSEFLSEALSDNELKSYLQSKPWTLKNMWEALKNGILQMLGIKTPKNMLEATLAVADRLMTRVPRATPADMKLDSPRLSRPMQLAPALQAALGTADQIVAKQRTWSDKVKANATGLAFETQLVDRFAGFERLAKYMDKLKGMQMLYYLRMYDQRMNFVAQSVGTGALDLVKKTRRDGATEYVIESQPGASIAGVARILKDANPILGNVDNTNRLFTMYLAAKRAERVDFSKLNFGDALTEAKLRRDVAAIEATPGLESIFKRARNEYNKYNEGLVRFAEKAGAIKKDVADELLKAKDYIPYYRQRQDGVVELLIGGETPITVGSIKQQPYLKDLIGGDTAILDFMRSSVQNTNMLVDMALRNLATKNAMYELVNLGAAKLTGATSGPDVVQFKEDGEDKYAVIDTGKFDIPAELLVKGMEGIPLQTTGLLHAMSLPAKLLRKAVTLNPLYSARQLFRDSLGAVVMSGADFTPVLGALKEIGSPTAKTLERRGIVGGQQFTGTQEDLSLILRQITSGQGSLATLLGKAEAFSMEADALTRRAQYNSYIRQGLSEMEATLLSLESMNFNKRGASPSIHAANALIPFFNAQIQGLNVLYKAMFGKASVAEKARIKEKLITRGLMLMAISLAYTHAMQDDEAYQNALPDQKYGNWFVRIPGVAEPLRLPVPFEVGYIFKSLPEALYNSLMSKEGAEGAQEAMTNILRNVIPGGGSYFIPQAAKPAIESLLNRSFFTGRDIVSTKEQKLLPEAQYRENTTELAKLFGGLGVSPIKFEALVNGYTGTLGMALLGALSLPISAEASPEKAEKRLSELPVVGAAFQPNDASWIINNTYDSLKEAQQVEQTFKEYLARGEKAKATELINTRANDYATANFGDYYAQTMRKLTQLETAVKASDRSPEEKRALLDKIRQDKIKFAAMVREASERTKPQ